MSLSLKAELETWAAALKAYDEQDFEKALALFSRIADSSKILTNMGLIYATIGKHETAIEHFVAATNLDSYLAIAYFQCGVSNFLIGRYGPALLNFEDAYLHLRGNEAINYEQIGLKFKLFSAEVMFNKGLAQINLGYMEGGLADLREASKSKVTDEHGVIDDALRDRGEEYTVFSIPVGVLYRPSESKLKNSKSKDYLGKAKLVAASDSSDAFTEFTGVKKLQQASGENSGNTEDKDKPDAESSALNRSVTLPPPRMGPAVIRHTGLERSRTAVPPGSRQGPGVLTSQRSQSVSNPVNVPPIPPLPLGHSRSYSMLAGGSSTRLTRVPTTSMEVVPLRVKTPQGTAAGIADVGASGSRAGGETGTGADGTPTVLRSRPNLGRFKGQEAPAPPPSLPPLQLGQYVNAVQDTPLVLPAVPSPTQEAGPLTQFYDTYIDAYTDDSARPPIPQAQAPEALPFHQQPQPQSREQQQTPTWVQSAPNPIRTSGNTSSSSRMSRVSSRGANGGMGKGGISNTPGGTSRRRPTHRPATRRTTVYDDDEGDRFSTGEIDEFVMANIRVKLHYQGDVRGMAIPYTTSFKEFVERVTTKFGTSLAGLGMKFVDEDGSKISLRDESDFELAIETARESGNGRTEGKMEVWCVNM